MLKIMFKKNNGRNKDKNVDTIDYMMLIHLEYVSLCILYVVIYAFPLQAWTGLSGSRGLRLLEFLENRHIKVVRLLALSTGRLYPPPPRR
jgi:hypothetical protein